MTHIEDKIIKLAMDAMPDFLPWTGNPDDEPLPSGYFYAFRDALDPPTAIALASVVRAARALATKNKVSADLTNTIAALDDKPKKTPDQWRAHRE